MKQLCPRCKGDRLVFDPSSLLLNVIFPIVWLMERNDKREDKPATKMDCPTCEGKGYLKF